MLPLNESEDANSPSASGQRSAAAKVGSVNMLRTQRFAIEKIYVPVKRRKTLNSKIVREIAESMLEVGQQIPRNPRSCSRPRAPSGRPCSRTCRRARRGEVRQHQGRACLPRRSATRRTMRLYIFKSGANSALRAFAGDVAGSGSMSPLACGWRDRARQGSSLQFSAQRN